jgi:hypothetical protein
MSLVVLRPKNEKARRFLEENGDKWNIAVTVPDPEFRDSRRVMLENAVDHSTSVWVNEKYDESFEIIYM